MLAQTLLQIILFLIVTRLLYVYWKNRKFRDIYSKYPTNLKRVPLIDHAVNFMGSAEDRMNTIKKIGEETITTGQLVTFWLGPKCFVMVGDAVDTEFILKTSLEKDEIARRVSHKLLGNGTIIGPVSFWRPRRKAMAPTFGQKTLNSFVKIFSKQSSILAEKLEPAAGNGDVALFDEVAKYSMDSICETVFGVQVKSQNTADHPAVEALQQFLDLIAQRMLGKPWLYLEILYKWHRDYPAFESSVNVLQQFVGKRHTFLQEETLVMLVAGTDTSSVVVSFTALMLAKHPDIQEKVYQEIKSEIGTTMKNIGPNDLPRLKYLEAVIKETMRLYPPVPLLSRKIVEDVTLPSGVQLAGGMSAMIHIYAIHRDPKYWGSDARQFKPERFLEPLENPSSYMPFSNGPRNCIGYQYAMMSMKTACSNLFRRYKILPAKGSALQDLPDDGLPLEYSVMMRHRDFKVQLELRNN